MIIIPQFFREFYINDEKQIKRVYLNPNKFLVKAGRRPSLSPKCASFNSALRPLILRVASAL